MTLDKEPIFEKTGSICLCKNNIEDTKRVSMKFIPTAAFFLKLEGSNLSLIIVETKFSEDFVCDYK